MKNLWPSEFETSDLPSTKELLEEQAKLLPQLTNDMVHADIVQLDEFDMIRYGLSNDFGYRFDIRGKFLKDYRFNLFSFSHDITLFPVVFKLDEKIATEVVGKQGLLPTSKVTIKDAEELENLLSHVFGSARLKSVISSIIRLSK
ncbi:hypothetical protein C9422_18985 [Pseudomonas sp. B1(2018)]|uniref:hypothetical protein n=1 Tax=Pseudomonas sp. B1(2018) TaxID=2233856 RepID=UPI000D5F89E2|nr:hypothetical protein [Pseudomonas sp. B1(2018)]PVZ56603.1 hypothetical protein C9422_18985 [Pseudomonas sp. B1(2018)]